MEDFVLTKNISDLYQHNADQIRNYAQLLKQPPELWMFVPCDEYGKVMIVGKGMIPIDSPSYMGIYTAYHTAKQRCLFEGFEIIFQDNNSLIVRRNLVRISFHANTKCVTFDLISDLTKRNLPLSQTAINKIYQ